MSASNTSPIVTEVLRFEDLPPGSRGTRRAIARWSDGSESEALTWYADEILICEGDHGNSRLMVLACWDAWCSWLDRREEGT
jgi:hypothetical protein